MELPQRNVETTSEELDSNQSHTRQIDTNEGIEAISQHFWQEIKTEVASAEIPLWQMWR